jgi:hypothetical protein
MSVCVVQAIRPLVGSLKMNTALEYSTRVVQEGDRRCKKSTLNDLAYLTPLRIPLMNPVHVCAQLLYCKAGRTITISTGGLFVCFFVCIQMNLCTEQLPS